MLKLSSLHDLLTRVVPEYNGAYHSSISNLVEDQNGILILTYEAAVRGSEAINKEVQDYILQYDLLKGRKKVCL